MGVKHFEHGIAVYILDNVNTMIKTVFLKKAFVLAWSTITTVVLELLQKMIKNHMISLIVQALITITTVVFEIFQNS